MLHPLAKVSTIWLDFWKHYSTKLSHYIDEEYLEFEEDGTVKNSCYTYFEELCSKGGRVKLSFHDSKLTGCCRVATKEIKNPFWTNIYTGDADYNKGIPFSAPKIGHRSVHGDDLILFFNPNSSELYYLVTADSFFVYPDSYVGVHSRQLLSFTEYYKDGRGRMKYKMDYETKQAVVAGDYGSLENAVNMRVGDF